MAAVDTATTLADTATSKGDQGEANGIACRKAKGNAKSKGKAKATAKERATALNGDRGQAIGPPFKLHHRTKPCLGMYLTGTVADEPDKFITGISIKMSSCFSDILEAVLEEAIDGALPTKGHAIDRRNELVTKHKRNDEYAETLADEQAVTAEGATQVYIQETLVEDEEGSQVYVEAVPDVW